MGLSVDSFLRWNLRIAFATYFVVFVVLGFTIARWDYDHLSAYYEMAWRFWRHSPGLPEFNPYLCGGRTLGADPQIPIFSPLPLLIGLIGPTWTLKLEMFLQLLAGSWGLWKLLEKIGADRSGQRWGLFLFVTGGGVVSRYLVGHVTLGFLILLPLFLLLSYRLQSSRGRESLRLFAAYAVLFAYSASYKPNFVINAALILGFEALVRSFLLRNLRPLLWFTGAAILAGLYAAPTYLPSYFYFRDIPRFMDPATLAPLDTFLLNLIMPLRTIPERFFVGRHGARHEVNLYVGVIALFFAWLGLKQKSLRARPELFALVITGAFFAWVGFGWDDQQALSYAMPAHYLKSIWPGFFSVRVSERFWFATYLAIIALAAVGWKTPERRAAQLLVMGLGVLPGTLSTVINLAKVVGDGSKTQFSGSGLYTDDFSQEVSSGDETYLPLREGKGTIQCLYNVETHTGKEIHPGRLLESVASPGVTVQAHWENWNTIRLELDNPYPARVRFNLNHSPFWTWVPENGKAKILSQFEQPLTLWSDHSFLKGRLVFRQPWVKESAIAFALGSGSLLVLVALALRRRP